MANTLLTINQITREAVRLWKNSNAFIQNINTQYDDSFAKTGAKIGQTLRIRLPNDYTVRTGAVAQVQDTSEQNTSLVVATQKGVDLSFSSVERTMSLDDYSTRVLAPAVNNLAGDIATDIMSGAEAGVANLVVNLDGGGAITNPTAKTFLTAKAILMANSSPSMKRKLVVDPFTEINAVTTLSGLFNPATAISKQYESGSMYNALGFDWMADQTVIKHTTGSFSAGTVNGAGQTGNTLFTNAITGTLNVGDIVTLAGVNGVNRITKTTTGQARQFVVTAFAPSGSTQISVYPAIVPPVSGNKVQYQTVTASPANGAAITLGTPANSTFRKNIAFIPDAITMATADLDTSMGPGVIEVSRQAMDGISMRMVTAYNVLTDQTITRLDVLYGYTYLRPEWCVAVGDMI